MNESDSRGKACGACGSEAVYCRTMPANGGYGPRFLAGLGRMFEPAKLDVHVCADCGYMRFFAGAAERQRLKDARGWRRLG